MYRTTRIHTDRGFPRILLWFSFQLIFFTGNSKICTFVAHQENCLTHRALYIREINFFTLLNFFLADTEKAYW